MIIYFSATGNNKYIATRIREELNDEIHSMIQLVNNEEYMINLDEDEMLGFVIPTYFGGLPSYVEEYLSHINIETNGNNYIYVISSYGTTTGYSTGYFKEYLEDINIEVDATYSVKMADTWTPMFDLSSPEKVNEFMKNTEDEIDTIIDHIKNSDKGDYVKQKNMKFVSNFAQILYDRKRKTSHLHVLDNCIKCGICQKNCPIQAIRINDGHVEWIYDRCVMCLRCLHSCPKFSIQYDNKTLQHGQYTNVNINELD